MKEARGSRLLDVVGSAVTALLFFAAIPAVLIVIVGNPLSGGLGHQWGHLDRTALGVLTAVAWISWVACCAQLLRAVVHHVRRGVVGVPLGAPLTERIAGRIAVGILAVTTMGTPLVLTSAAGAGAAITTTVHVGAPPARLHAEPPASLEGTDPSGTSYLVRPGDSLWSIADTELGDGADWTSIARLNLGRTMADGRRLIDPDLLLAHWTLLLPPGSGPTFAAVGPAAGTAHHAPAHRSSTLPELLVLGIGSIGCAALARRSRRLRLVRHSTPAQWDDPFEPSEAALDTDVLLSRFEGAPVLTAFEAANCMLGAAVGAGATHPVVPRVRTVCVGPSGVTFHLAAAVPGEPAPPGFTLSEDGQAWHIALDLLGGQEFFSPYLPVVLPVGDDAQGTWLVPLQPGAVLPLLGEGAPAWWRAARPVQESWSWAEMVVVTEDPLEAARLSGGGSGRGGGTPVLYVGDPASLPSGSENAVAVVTTAPVPASDVTLLVDRHGASIHPLGLTVRPHLMTDGTARLVHELLRTPSVRASEPDPIDPSPPFDAPVPTSGAAPFSAEPRRGPGLVEVKLLTMTPRLDGLSEALAPNRARRAVELVAYLALHRPDVVTSDRLRTRVLGSSDADAASKTLFNTATAARRAMGFDPAGDLLFPAGSRNGHYSVSEEVTVDVQRAAELAAFGNACEDPAAAIAHLRLALKLVEGEPLANALSGYSWWEVEGHGGRIAAVLVNAACNLAALTVERKLFDLAQWGLSQARLVDPYSEALSRAAMQVAAAEGDADRLRREWRECQRRVDEVDPGSSPSPRTERLYGELSRAVPVGAAGGNGSRGDS